MQITDLTSYSTPALTDVLPIVDVVNDTTKKVTVENLVPAGSITNAKLSTSAGEVGAAWATFTPALANVSGGTLNYAKYIKVGKTVHGRLKYTMAGAGVAGAVSFTLPVAAHTDYGTSDNAVGVASFTDTGTALYSGVVYTTASATVAQIRVNGSAGSYANLAALSSTIPFTWATGDAIEIVFTYEAA